jgi:DNA-binding NarL/FixJ family response regulator
MGDTATTSAPKVVIVEDNYLIAEDLRELCQDFGAQVSDVLYRAEGAVERILELAPDVVLMDVRLDGVRDGVDIAIDLHTRCPQTQVVFVTGSDEPPMIARINQDHPHRILVKPVAPERLREALGLSGRR